MKKIIILLLFSFGVSAQNILGLVGKDTSYVLTRPPAGLVKLAWLNDELYIVKPQGNTEKIMPRNYASGRSYFIEDYSNTGGVRGGSGVPIESRAKRWIGESELKNGLNINNIDNTSDANKPISIATQEALDLKLSSTTAVANFLPIKSPVASGTLTAPTIVNTLGGNFASISGNVGIGTTSPTMKLDVNGGARFGTTYVSPSYTNTINTGYGADVDGQELYFNYVGYNDGFTRFRNTSIANGKASSILYAVGSTGRVGIGTTTPLRSLDVTDAIRSTSNFAGFEAIYNTGTSYRFTLANDNNYYLQSSSDKFVANATTRFSLFDGGNIGIGTSTNLGYKLDVIGSTRATRFEASSTTAMTLTHNGFQDIHSSGTLGTIRFLDAGYGNVNLQIEQTGNTYIRGNLGIGTTTPSQKLSVVVPAGTSIPTSGSAGGHQILSNGTYGMMFGVNNSGNGWIQAARTDAIATNYNLLLNPNGGNVGIGTTVPRNTIEINGVTAIPTALSSNTANGTLLLSDGGNLGVVQGISNYNSSYQGYVQARNNVGTNSLAYDYLINPLGGNVGIGTTAPAYKLDVNGTARVAGDLSMTGTYPILTLFGSQSGSLNIRLQNYITGVSNTGFEIYDQTNTASRLAITGTGNVGIGTSTPTSKLHIEGDNSSTTAETVLTLRGNGENGKRIDFRNAFGSLARITGTKLATGASADEGILTFETSTNSILSEKMRITDLGNIGIGTTAPTEKLEIGGGNVKIANNQKLHFGDGANANGFSIGSVGTTNEMLLSQNNNAALKFNVGFSSNVNNVISFTRAISTESMRIDGSGNVSIGTSTNSGFKLDVNGTAQVTQFKLSALNSAPASATASGTIGEIRVTATHIFVCTATNTWVRSPLTSW